MSETIPQLLDLTMIRRYVVPLSPSTLYEMISRGTFPTATVRIGRKIRLWHRHDVESWVDNASATPRKEVPGVA